jgi:hypothetical protein
MKTDSDIEEEEEFASMSASKSVRMAGTNKNRKSNMLFGGNGPSSQRDPEHVKRITDRLMKNKNNNDFIVEGCD